MMNRTITAASSTPTTAPTIAAVGESFPPSRTPPSSGPGVSIDISVIDEVGAELPLETIPSRLLGVGSPPLLGVGVGRTGGDEVGAPSPIPAPASEVATGMEDRPSCILDVIGPISWAGGDEFGIGTLVVTSNVESELGGAGIRGAEVSGWDGWTVL